MASSKKRIWGKWQADAGSIDQGGQGQIYRVRDTSNERSEFFILKELKNPKRVARFENEILAISSLERHPNVVHLVDSGVYRDPTKPSYVMPEADMALDRYVEKHELTVATLLDLFAGILSGVSHIHQAEIIHRDLKPENILMFGDIPRVSDLGLCLISDVPRVTDTEEAVGPRYYMAPELEDGRTPGVTNEADIYSLGKLLYFLLSKNRRIFSREKFRQKDWSLSHQHSDDRYTMFDQLFSRSVTASRHDRFKNIAAFSQALDEIKAKFAQHPGTVLRQKLPSRSCTWEAPLNELNQLTHPEWHELLRLRNEARAPFSRHVLNAVKANAHPSFASNLAKEILRQRSHMSHDELVEWAKIVVLQEEVADDPWFALSESWPEIHALALETGDKDVCNRIALSQRKNGPKPLEMLAPYFKLLTPQARLDYLERAIEFPFPNKEYLFLEACEIELDTTERLWLTAGLVQCGTTKCIEQIVAMLRRCGSANEAQDIIGGIVLKGEPSLYDVLLSAGGFTDEITRMITIMGELRDSVERKQKNEEEDDDEF